MFWRLFHYSTIQRYNHVGPNSEEPWALVTGASDGIGKGVSKELMAQGFNVLLHGRNEAKLHNVRQELLSLYPARSASIFVWDATTPLSPGGLNLTTALLTHINANNIYLTALVNNVGYTSNFHTFMSQDPREIDAVVNLQVLFLIHITRAVLPALSANQPGLIINVGGLTGLFPTAFLAVHSGGKAFLANFSRALAIELELIREPPVDIECIAVDVHNVATNSNGSDVSFFTPSADRMGRAIIGVVGCGHRSVTAYWKAEMVEYVLRCLPSSWMDSLLAGEMLKMRARELASKRDRYLDVK
ncbi:NAD(P)-binding protein [Ceratobasidium sp. AG-I]|nr:NAD(P)-binding protein [Ceratobasidium sp. AG-I]